MYVRYPVPVFEHEELKDRTWSSPDYLPVDEQQRLLAAARDGDESVFGAYPVMPDEALMEALQVRGEHRHAVMCLMPSKPVRVLGRSYAWARQQVFILDSLDAVDHRILASFNTPRPMNNRLGPDDGIEIDTGVCYALFAHMFADYFPGNRTLMDNDWRDPGTGTGFRVCSSYDDELEDFHDAVLHFSW
jgi:hypothetical protein